MVSHYGFHFHSQMICNVVQLFINIQKSVVFVYINSKLSEREIEEIIPFTTETRRTNYLGINLPKETKDLYAENYDTDEKNQR